MQHWRITQIYHIAAAPLKAWLLGVEAAFRILAGRSA